MGHFLFIGQKTLGAWMEQDKIDFDCNVMTIKGNGRSFKLMEAVRFLKVEGGDVDKAGLLGTVKTDQKLAAMGAERYRDSVICQEVAYKVQEGFMAEILVDEPIPSIEAAENREAKQPPTDQVVIPLTKPKKPVDKQIAERSLKPALSTKDLLKKAKLNEELSDEELLVRFLLDNSPK